VSGINANNQNQIALTWRHRALTNQQTSKARNHTQPMTTAQRASATTYPEMNSEFQTRLNASKASTHSWSSVYQITNQPTNVIID
jgi:hypothetical protein